MSQTDLNLANQAGAPFRAELNLHLAAIASNNSGATAPTTTFAYMWWYDTTTNILKQRNAADNAWISMFRFDQTAGTWSAILDYAELVERGTDPTAIANSHLLYAKDVGGVTEIFSRDDSGDVIQINWLAKGFGIKVAA